MSVADTSANTTDERDVRPGQADLSDEAMPGGLVSAASPLTSGDPGQPIITVRSARAGDALGVRRVRGVLRLNQPESLLDRAHPVRRCLANAVPWPSNRSRLYVASHGSRIRGFVQVEPVWPDQRWIITQFGGSGSDLLESRVSEALLAHTVVSAGSSGVKRVFGRVDGRLPLGAAFRAVGFNAYASETIYLAQGLTAPTTVPSVRRQEQTDTWAIHQLYNAAVPRQVQYAEAYTSHRWDVARRPGRMPKNGTMTGWLVEEGHHVVGYVRVASREGTHVIELVFHPDRREVIGDLIDGALGHIVQHQPKRVFFPLRSYQSEIGQELISRGFRPVWDQHLYLKYTTANVRVPAPDAVHLHLEVREKVPQRVPTFLHGSAPDESVPGRGAP